MRKLAVVIFVISALLRSGSAVGETADVVTVAEDESNAAT
jgi:hypothetical protein